MKKFPKKKYCDLVFWVVTTIENSSWLSCRIFVSCSPPTRGNSLVSVPLPPIFLESSEKFFAFVLSYPFFLCTAWIDKITTSRKLDISYSKWNSNIFIVCLFLDLTQFSMFYITPHPPHAYKFLIERKKMLEKFISLLGASERHNTTKWRTTFFMSFSLQSDEIENREWHISQVWVWNIFPCHSLTR